MQASVIAGNAVNTLLPYRGSYYQWNRPGNMLTLETDANGVSFAQFNTFDKDGNPFYYIVQAVYRPTTEQERIETGIIGRIDAKPYVVYNGECVGAGCLAGPFDAVVQDFQIHLTWTEPRQVHVQIGAQEWDMRGGQITVEDEASLVGWWSYYDVSKNARSEWGGYYYSPGLCRIEKASTRFTPADFPGVGHDEVGRQVGVAIPATARLHRMHCVHSEPRVEGYSATLVSGSFPAWKAAFVWYVPETHRMGLFTAVMGRNDTAPTEAKDVYPITGSLYLDGPLTMRGRWDFTSETNVQEEPKSSNGEIVFTKLPPLPDGKEWTLPPKPTDPPPCKPGSWLCKDGTE